MQKTVKIFRWSESLNKTEVVNGTFNDNSKVTLLSIELKRRENEEMRNSQFRTSLANWSV
jgi:hypothetical protein